MRQTLFYIPYEVASVPLFGVGLLLALWALFMLGVIVWLARKPGGWSELAGHLPLLLLIGAAIIFLPRLFPEDGLPIRGYGVMLLVAIVCGVGFSMHRAQQLGLHPDLIFSLAFWMFLAGIIGARAFHVIQKWETDYVRNTWGETLIAVINVPQGGLVVYGSLIGAGLAFIFFTRRHRLPMLALADMIAPSLLIGLALGRVGCLLNGCCFGGTCDLPWAVSFPAGSPPFARQAEQGELLLYGIRWPADLSLPPVVEDVVPGSPAAVAGLKPGDQLLAVELEERGYQTPTAADALYALMSASQQGVPVTLVTSSQKTLALPAQAERLRSRPVHPTQLYSTIGAALICFFLIAYYPYRRRDGEVTALLLTIYPLVRILEESLRTDEPGMFGTMLSISQIVSLGMLAGVSVLWVYISKQPTGSAFPR